MGLRTVSGWNHWLESAEARMRSLGGLNIGPRLILGFVFIILSMLAADAFVLWQFHVVRSQAARLNDIDQSLVSVLRVQTSLLAFYDRLDTLADAEDAGRLVTEAAPLRDAVLEHISRATSTLSLPPFDLQRDPTILPTLRVIQSAVPSQLEGITTLATSGDWRAVHMRLANQVRPVASLASALVEKVAQEAGDQQAQIVLNMRRVQRLVFLAVPLTAVLSLLIAATLGLAITRSITEPLAGLVEGSKALARGEFQHQVSVTGKDELAHLGHVFNDTAHRLRHLYATLQSSEAYLAEAQRVSHTGSFGWCIATGQIVWSDETYRIFQYESTTIPTVERVFHRTHPEDAAFVKETLERASQHRQDLDFEHRLVMPDGSIKHVRVVGHAERDPSRTFEYVGALLDITERKQAEEALRQSQAELAHVSRVTTLGEMAASIAHEVDQPLSGVVINANACVRFLSAAVPNLDEVRDGLRAIARDGRRASEVIAKIRAIARRAPTEREPLDMNQVIREVLVLAEGEARRTQARLLTALTPDLPPVLGDRVQLQQVVLNLLLNGLDAMRAVVDRPRELVILTEREDTDRVRVAVRDSGAGIDPELVDRVFDAFYTTKGSGMGMGLSISRSIVEQHGGRLWAVPNDGPGTTFQFTV